MSKYIVNIVTFLKSQYLYACTYEREKSDREQVHIRNSLCWLSDQKCAYQSQNQTYALAVLSEMKLSLTDLSDHIACNPNLIP